MQLKCYAQLAPWFGFVSSLFRELFKGYTVFHLKNHVQMDELLSSFENGGVKCFNLVQHQFTELNLNETILSKIFLEIRI